jgi:hypothetical protein
MKKLEEVNPPTFILNSGESVSSRKNSLKSLNLATVEVDPAVLRTDGQLASLAGILVCL